MSDEPKANEEWKEISAILQDLGIAKDSKRMQILEKVYNPEIKESLTVLPTTRTVIHLNFMKGLADALGGELGDFVNTLRNGEIDHYKSIKGVGLERFTTAIENQNAADVTVRNETIPQQIEPKKSFWGRLKKSD